LIAPGQASASTQISMERVLHNRAIATPPTGFSCFLADMAVWLMSRSLQKEAMSQAVPSKVMSGSW